MFVVDVWVCLCLFCRGWLAFGLGMEAGSLGWEGVGLRLGFDRGGLEGVWSERTVFKEVRCRVVLFLSWGACPLSLGELRYRDSTTADITSRKRYTKTSRLHLTLSHYPTTCYCYCHCYC